MWVIESEVEQHSFATGIGSAAVHGSGVHDHEVSLLQ
jgi:hypothetical protein